MHGLLLLAPGSREGGGSAPFEAIRDAIRAQRPECPIVLSFSEAGLAALEACVDELVAEGAAAITVFPLFMARGEPFLSDLPRMLETMRAAHPHLPLALEIALCDMPDVRQAIAEAILSRVD